MDDLAKLRQELEQIEQGLKALNGLQGDSIEQSRATMQTRQKELVAILSGSGAIAQGSDSIGTGFTVFGSWLPCEATKERSIPAASQMRRGLLHNAVRCSPT